MANRKALTKLVFFCVFPASLGGTGGNVTNYIIIAVVIMILLLVVIVVSVIVIRRRHCKAVSTQQTPEQPQGVDNINMVDGPGTEGYQELYQEIQEDEEKASRNDATGTEEEVVYEDVKESPKPIEKKPEVEESTEPVKKPKVNMYENVKVVRA